MYLKKGFEMTPSRNKVVDQKNHAQVMQKKY